MLPPKEEPFKLIHFLIFTISRPGKSFKKCKLFLLITMLLLCCCQVLSFFDSTLTGFDKFFVASVYLFVNFVKKIIRINHKIKHFQSIPALLSLTFLLDVENLLRYKEHFYWSLDFVGEEFRNRCFKYAKRIEVWSFISLSVLLVIEAPLFLAVKAMRKADYSIILIGRYIPQFEPVYVYLLIFYLMIILLISTSWLFYFIYFDAHLLFQVLMLSTCIRSKFFKSF